MREGRREGGLISKILTHTAPQKSNIYAFPRPSLSLSLSLFRDHWRCRMVNACGRETITDDGTAATASAEIKDASLRSKEFVNDSLLRDDSD